MAHLPSLSDLSGSIFFNGALARSANGRTHEVTNPADGTVLCACGWGDAADAIGAILNSHHAFADWRNMLPAKRSRLLSTIGNNLRNRADEFARILTLEQGKPLREAKAEVHYAAEYFDWFAGECRRAYGDIVQSDSPDRRILVCREPIGVTAAITPWNFPVAMLARKAAAALAAGCTMVSKPAPETPLSAILLAWICCESGLPAGVLNVIPGDAEEISGAFFDSDFVRKVTFTGSTAVGKLLIGQSANKVKRLTLELGGNAPFILLKDANLALATEHAVFAKYRNCGQACVAANRFLVHSNLIGNFSEAFVEASKMLRVGSGLNAETDLGPLITDAAVLKVREIVADAISQGAKQILGPDPGEINARFVPPIILTGITPAMRLWKEEVFGPVAGISEFDDSSDIIGLANDTPHGLAAYVFGDNSNELLRISEALHFGMVGLNDAKIMGVQAPFGGIKESGYGREGSKYGLDDYTNLKYLSVHSG